MRKGLALLGLAALVAGTAPEAKGDLTYEVNTTDKEVAAQLNAGNIYPDVTLDSYSVNWLDDYAEALFLIPENSSTYASKEAMLADSANAFVISLDSLGDIDIASGWTLKSNGAELGDETIENNGGVPGVTYAVWDNGKSALPTITHDMGLVDVDNDGVPDYELATNPLNQVNYGIGHTTQGNNIPQTGGEIAFVAIPEPATLTLVGIAGLGLLYIRRRFANAV